MLKSHFTRIVSHRRGRLLVGDQVNAHIKTLNFLIRYDIILIMINDVTHLSEELPGPGVEPDCLLHEVPRVLGVAHLLDLVLGGVDPEGGVCHVHLQHPAEGASYHVVPPLENRISFQNSRGTSDYVTYCQRLNSVMDCECCCCEQPISKQNFLFTVISLDAHNNNIRNPSQNSASGTHS